MDYFLLPRLQTSNGNLELSTKTCHIILILSFYFLSRHTPIFTKSKALVKKETTVRAFTVGNNFISTGLLPLTFSHFILGNRYHKSYLTIVGKGFSSKNQNVDIKLYAFLFSFIFAVLAEFTLIRYNSNKYYLFSIGWQMFLGNIFLILSDEMSRKGFHRVKFYEMIFLVEAAEKFWNQKHKVEKFYFVLKMKINKFFNL